MVVAHLLHKVRVSEEGLTVRHEKHVCGIILYEYYTAKFLNTIAT